MKRKELLKSREYWLTLIQNDLFNLIYNYQKKKKLNQSQLAKELGVSKGYISQILSGDFNHKVSKLVDLALAFNMAPKIIYSDLDDYIEEDEKKYNETQWSSHINQIVDTNFARISYQGILENLNLADTTSSPQPSITELYNNGGQTINTTKENQKVLLHYEN